MSEWRVPDRELREPPPLADRYPSIGRTPHRWRTRRANAIAALALVGAIALVIGILALF